MRKLAVYWGVEQVLIEYEQSLMIEKRPMVLSQSALLL